MRRAIVIALVGACSFSTTLPSGTGDGPPPGTSPEAGAVSGQEASVAGCQQGMACDDNNACTELDACVSGTCSGIDDLCPAQCATTCAACGGDTCCAESCPGGVCADCPAGCDCSQSCGTSRPCRATCIAGASCKIFGTNNETDGAYQVTCQAGSYCVVDCVGDQGTGGGCVVTCEAGATCLVIDSMLAAGTTLNCPSGTVTCPAPNTDIKVCNRPCP